MPAGEHPGGVGRLDRLWEWAQSASRSEFSRNAMWLTTLSGFERLMAAAQTVVISRALGITEYGVYGLLFGTIGFVASVVGFQMGLTATVFVSRYRETDKARAAGVISVVSRFALIAAATLVAVALPFGQRLSEVLLGSSHYQVAVVLGIVFVGATILSGVQDGVAQGFEIFGTLAKLKIVVAVLVLASVYPAALTFGLNGVLCAILLGLVLKGAVLHWAIRQRRVATGVPAAGAGVSFRALVGNFALPSMVVSLLVGFVIWLGMFLLSRQQSGFNEVAIVSTGLQWRGPVLLLTAALGGVAVPVFSRLSAAGDAKGSRRFRRRLALLNLSMASVAALVMVAGSGVIMTLYGAGFSEGRVAFCLIVLSTVPTVVADVYVHELVGSARMWRQLWLHLASLVALCVSFAVLVPRYHAVGYAASVLIGSVVFLGQLVAADIVKSRRERLGAGA